MVLLIDSLGDRPKSWSRATHSTQPARQNGSDAAGGNSCGCEPSLSMGRFNLRESIPNVAHKTPQFRAYIDILQVAVRKGSRLSFLAQSLYKKSVRFLAEIN